jgi:rubrerythrin
MAYLIEQDFSYFYNRAAEVVDEPEVKKFLLDMAGWEKQHSNIFQKKYQKLLEKSWGDIAELML